MLCVPVNVPVLSTHNTIACNMRHLLPEKLRAFYCEFCMIFRLRARANTFRMQSNSLHQTNRVRRNRQKPQRYFKAQFYLFPDGTAGGSGEAFICLRNGKTSFGIGHTGCGWRWWLTTNNIEKLNSSGFNDWAFTVLNEMHFECATRVNIKSNVSQYCNWFYYFIQFYITRRRVGARCTWCSYSKYVFIVAEPFSFLLHFLSMLVALFVLCTIDLLLALHMNGVVDSWRRQ